MKIYDSTDTKDEKFKSYQMKLSGYLFKNGRFEVEDLTLYDDLPKEIIKDFFEANSFDTREIPQQAERWYVDAQYFSFRKANDRVAKKERQEEIKLEQEAYKKRLVDETINDKYIPKDLGECFAELNKILPEISRNEIKALKDRKDMIIYHHGLGTWLRNNWGLWGGSRLQKYFTDKGITHPDDMSGIILNYYWDWLNGNKDSWKNWEKNPK